MQITRSPYAVVTLYLMTAAALIVCGLILWPLVPAITGAVTLAVVLRSPYDRLHARIPQRNACATVAIIIVMLAIIIPGFFVGQAILEQGIHAVSLVRHNVTQEGLAAFFLRHPTLARHVNTITAELDLDEVLKATAAFLGHQLLWILDHSVLMITQLIFLLFILFFLLRDRAQALLFTRSLLPLRDDEADQLLTRVDDMITATALGRLAISVVQGFLAGLGYWALGVPGVFLWAFVTSVASLIPSFGTVLVWAPIALYLGLTGHWGRALLMALWGGCAVGLIDNILYPIFVGSRIQAHTVTVLLSIIGGITLFGFPGIILGPVSFTIAAALLDIWRGRLNEGNAAQS